MVHIPYVQGLTQASVFQDLMTSPITTDTFTRDFGIEQTINYIIEQLLTIESLNMTLIATIEYEFYPRLPPRAILIFFGGYHVISNDSIVNYCITFIYFV